MGSRLEVDRGSSARSCENLDALSCGPRIERLHLSARRRRQRLEKGYWSPRETACAGKDLARSKNREQNHDGQIKDNGRDGNI